MLWEFLPIFASQNKSIMNKLLSTLLLVMLSLTIGAQQKSAYKGNPKAFYVVKKWYEGK